MRAVAFAVLLFAAPFAHADDAWPAHPIILIVPFAPGGGNDFIARFIAERLGHALGQTVIVDNKAGAGGMVGVRAAVSAKPDGYTLLLISNSYTVNPSLYKLNFDPVADVTPIVQIAQGPFVVVANPSLPAKTLADAIALARAKPGEINYASSGLGSIPHLATELLAYKAGIRLTHIPYKGGGPALTDTIGGRVSLFLSPTSTALQHVKAGTLRALAVTTATRSPVFPDVPTVAESGVPGYDVTLWHGLIGPKGLPAPIVARLDHEVDAIVHSKEASTVLEREGVTPAGGPPGRLQALIVREIATWHDVAERAGIKPE
jgi:tripartite-type tricarboxylate transporter receptor subunit TctC